MQMNPVKLVTPLLISLLLFLVVCTSTTPLLAPTKLYEPICSKDELIINCCRRNCLERGKKRYGFRPMWLFETCFLRCQTMVVNG